MKTNKMTKAEEAAALEAKRLKANAASRASRLRKKLKQGKLELEVVEKSKSEKFANAPQVGSIFYMPLGACRIIVTDKPDKRGFIPTERIGDSMKMPRAISDFKDVQKMVFVTVMKHVVVDESKKAA